ncbi:hypothetical protein CPB84DRAFT_1748694 [Gymnopilus junonius]|uniref:Uncharacterized protein n=1 Tax=Gymnopilus junonius TaxID=109634 RepID=A0A9P5NJH0_GYMJU|nr:hypothetical protein CPB84DRAFT_1748694 [Gymnopilus junonius]
MAAKSDTININIVTFSYNSVLYRGNVPLGFVICHVVLYTVNVTEAWTKEIKGITARVDNQHIFDLQLLRLQARSADSKARIESRVTRGKVENDIELEASNEPGHECLNICPPNRTPASGVRPPSLKFEYQKGISSSAPTTGGKFFPPTPPPLSFQGVMVDSAAVSCLTVAEDEIPLKKCGVHNAQVPFHSRPYRWWAVVEHHFGVHSRGTSVREIRSFYWRTVKQIDTRKIV